MGAFATGLRNTINKVSSLISSGVHEIHLIQGIFTTDKIKTLVGKASVSLSDIEPFIKFLPISDKAKSDLSSLILNAISAMNAVSANPTILNSIKEALSAEITSIIHEAVTGTKIDPATVILDIKNIFAAEGISL